MKIVNLQNMTKIKFKYALLHKPESINNRTIAETKIKKL